MWTVKASLSIILTVSPSRPLDFSEDIARKVAELFQILERFHEFAVLATDSLSLTLTPSPPPSLSLSLALSVSIRLLPSKLLIPKLMRLKHCLAKRKDAAFVYCAVLQRPHRKHRYFRQPSFCGIVDALYRRQYDIPKYPKVLLLSVHLTQMLKKLLFHLKHGTWILAASKYSTKDSLLLPLFLTSLWNSKAEVCRRSMFPPSRSFSFALHGAEANHTQVNTEGLQKSLCRSKNTAEEKAKYGKAMAAMGIPAPQIVKSQEVSLTLL